MDRIRRCADSRKKSFECGRRTGDRIGLISKVHGCDETSVHGEYVENLAIRKNIPLKAFDELVHPDADLASIFLGHRKRFDYGSNSPHCRVQ
jgi:hypothetical protein